MAALTFWLRLAVASSIASLTVYGLAAHVSGAAKATTAPADSLFAQPYVDVDEWRDAPVRHRYVHGGFRGTDTRFSFYFPPKTFYQGRFFQHFTPAPDDENLAQRVPAGDENKIGFSIASGGYFVETNGGGRAINSGPGMKADPTIGAWRANAAAAQYSRVVAQRFYGKGRPYGYAFGGSGGAYRTVGAFENTDGVWDGVVPYVLGSSMASPSNFTVRMHAMRILQDKFPDIVDAVEPGGSGDPYATLNPEQAGALREVTRMGFPVRSWFGYRTMGTHAFAAVYGGMMALDPDYFTDFWTKPGYLGFDHPESFAGARLQHATKVAAPITAAEAARLHLNTGIVNGTVNGGVDNAFGTLQATDAHHVVAFRLASPPPAVPFLGGDLYVLSGKASGQRLTLSRIMGDVAILGIVKPDTAAQILPGDAVRIDNGNFLAAQTYHRHQVPGPEFVGWNQFRGADGTPLYPQRSALLGPLFTKGASGALPQGKFHGKMILLESLWDREAFPWQADWYRGLVRQHLRAATDRNFRVWFTDHALHGDDARQEDPSRTVSYLGDLQQALRDLAAWVEKGRAPPASTRYRISDGQVIVPPTAPARRGIQPVVVLQANGGSHATVRRGQAVKLVGGIEVPPAAGVLIAADWDIDGSGRFATHADLPVVRTKASVRLSQRFDRPGTYFVTLRGTSQRQGDRMTPYARLYNLDRVRVVVK